MILGGYMSTEQDDAVARYEIEKHEVPFLLEELLKAVRQILHHVALQSPRYTMTASFETFEGENKKHMGATPPAVPTDNATVGQATIGVPKELVTDPNTGITGTYAFVPANIVWTVAGTLTSVTTDPTTGDGVFTAPTAAGSTTGTVTDTSTGATLTFDYISVPATLPNTYAFSINFAPAPTVPPPVAPTT